MNSIKLALFLICSYLLSTAVGAKIKSQIIVEYIQNKRWSVAEKELASYQKQYPQKKWAYSTRAWVLENLKKYDRGIRVCRRGLAKWPEEEKLRKAYGRLLNHKAKKTYGKQTQKLLQQSLEIYPRASTQHQLAKSYRRSKDYDKAIYYLEQGISRYPDYPYFRQSLPYTRYLKFKGILQNKQTKAIKDQVQLAVSWLQPKLSFDKQYHYLLMIRFGLRAAQDKDFFEDTYQTLFQKFPKQARIYDDYGFQLYANYRLTHPYKASLKKKAIHYRRKAYQLFWNKHRKPSPIANLAFPLNGRNMIWSEFGGSAMTHNGYANFCYDFAAVNQDGQYKNPQKSGTKNSHYYMFASPVYAVNDGIVSGVIAGYFDNPPGGFSASGNTITINHGSYSSFYAHLKYEGIVVKEKQKVKRGQLIGYNGNTGMSSESHLHFCVYSNRLPEYITIPFRFQKGKLITKSGKMIRSSRPYREGEIALFPNR